MHVIPRVRQACDERTDDDSEDKELGDGRIRETGSDHRGRGYATMAWESGERYVQSGWDARERGVLARIGASRRCHSTGW